MNILFNNNFQYQFGMDEIRGILENTFSKILFNARLSAFQTNPYYIVEYDYTTDLLYVELTLRDSVESYPEPREKQDLRKLANHYRALVTKYARHFQTMSEQYDKALLDCQKSISFAGILEEQLKSMLVHTVAFAKDNQYFLNFELQFVSLNRAMYDSTGRTCLLKFKIVPRP